MNAGYQFDFLVLAPMEMLLLTEECLTKPSLCGMYPIPLLLGKSCIISPSSGRISPAIVRSRVVFPIPDGPSIAIVSPG